MLSTLPILIRWGEGTGAGGYRWVVVACVRVPGVGWWIPALVAFDGPEESGLGGRVCRKPEMFIWGGIWLKSIGLRSKSRSKRKVGSWGWSDF